MSLAYQSFSDPRAASRFLAEREDWIGLGLLGYVSLWRASFGGRTQKSPGKVSRVRTEFVEMTAPKRRIVARLLADHYPQ